MNADRLPSRHGREKARRGRQFLHWHGNRYHRVEAEARVDRCRWEGERPLRSRTWKGCRSCHTKGGMTTSLFGHLLTFDV